MKNIKKQNTYKIKTINAAYKMIVQNTNTALGDTSIQYSIMIFGNQPDNCHEQ